MSYRDLTLPNKIDAVIEHPDPVVRNLLITQSYHELSRALYALFGGPDLPWTAFATWASKQAGRFIRHEEIPDGLRRFLELGAGEEHQPLERNGHGRNRHGRNGHRPESPFPAWLRGPRLLEYARCTAEDVARHAVEGNRLVYVEMARLYAHFLQQVCDLDRPSPARMARFLAFLAGEPSAGEKLERAFVFYYEALFETRPKPRAELVFLANALVGWHEQTRLQETIDGALKAPIRNALADPGRRLVAWPLPGPARRLGAAALERWAGTAIRDIEEEWQRVATECLMSLALPGRRLELGDDLPPLGGGAMFPAVLARLAHPAARAILDELDATPDTLRGSAARDWTRLGDRMNYILDLFRSRQRSRELLRPPFRPSQLAALQMGRRPGGAL